MEPDLSVLVIKEGDHQIKIQNMGDELGIAVLITRNQGTVMRELMTWESFVSLLTSRSTTR